MSHFIINPFFHLHTQSIGTAPLELKSTIFGSLISLKKQHAIYCFSPTVSDSVSIALRHDVDKNLGFNLAFAEDESSLGLSGTYYIIVAPNSRSYLADYDHTLLKPFVKSLIDLGHKVGLHSTAWSSENPIKALEIEIDIYSELLDRPITLNSPDLLFTHHGFPSKKNVRLARLKFEYLLLLKYHQFLYKRRKVILSDSNGILQFPHHPSLLKNHQSYEICFHPQYWF